MTNIDPLDDFFDGSHTNDRFLLVEILPVDPSARFGKPTKHLSLQSTVLPFWEI